MIQMINVNKIHPHPDNPRKDLGDLSELAESIKANGIFQNLTIVPWFSQISGVGCDDPKQQEEMGYRVVIGHRRLAAAKLAGLKEVPCSISDMDKKKQIATMLLENMQRSDLTIFEQAQGFQMMLNLGETINDISEKTGFSQTTVRRRVKLLELDQERLKDSVGRGATFMDYMELSKIENLELRNSVLETIGTSDFKWKLKSAIDQEKRDKVRAYLIEQLDTFATKIEEKKSQDGLNFVNTYYSRDYDEFKIPDDAETEKYYYLVSDYWISLYCEAKSEEVVGEKEDSKEREKRYVSLKETSKLAYKLRCDFIKNVSNSKAQSYLKYIIESFIYSIIDSYNSTDIDDIAKVVGIKKTDEGELEFADIVDGLRKQPERYLLIVAFINLDSAGEGYYDWHGRYRENEDLDRVYDLLEKLGYEISDEERQLRDGTHELFAQDEE